MSRVITKCAFIVFFNLSYHSYRAIARDTHTTASQRQLFVGLKDCCFSTQETDDCFVCSSVPCLSCYITTAVMAMSPLLNCLSVVSDHRSHRCRSQSLLKCRYNGESLECACICHLCRHKLCIFCHPCRQTVHICKFCGEVNLQEPNSKTGNGA